MAVLGFILGMGFLLPLPEGETRLPASVDAAEEADAAAFVSDPDSAALDSASKSPDRRYDVLFDIHTVAKNSQSKNSDAFVITRFKNNLKKDEIDSFLYCHNYDFKKMRAIPSLSRYEGGRSPLAFKCQRLELDDLAKEGFKTIYIGKKVGYGLQLFLKNFNPRKGGILQVVFIQDASDLADGDRSLLEFKISLADEKASIATTSGKPFDWINIKIKEILKVPRGVGSFELLRKEQRVEEVDADELPKFDSKCRCALAE